MTPWRQHYDNEPHRLRSPVDQRAPAATTAGAKMPSSLRTRPAGSRLAASTQLVLLIGLTAIMMAAVRADPVPQAPEKHHVAVEPQCPNAADNSACPCHKFEGGLFLECPGTTAIALRATMQLIKTPLQSLSVFDFDRSVVALPADIFGEGVQVRHLQFSHSHLESLRANSLKVLQPVLESLSIVNGRLKQVPNAALADMPKLQLLDFESNQIQDLPDYTFFGIRLVKLNLKGNHLAAISLNAFAGLEDYMSEIELSENRLRQFPVDALCRLEHLRSLRLASNTISSIVFGTACLSSTPAPGKTSIRPFVSLSFLDLSSNSFEQITEDTFRWFPSLKTLSLYSNRVETVHRNAFASLRELQSLDMSHNKVITMVTSTFASNRRLQTLDLSHNHLHYIGGLFSNLPELRELFLSENNILEVAADAFSNSSRISVVYLEDNAIQTIDADAFQTLTQLEQLYMSSNFLEALPRTLLSHCTQLTSLSLDGNQIESLEAGTFNNLNVLREIRLQNNRLSHIRQRVFHPLPGLLELHLQRNQIAKIDTTALASLVSLQHISLQHNELRELDVVFPANSSALLSIQLDSNHISVVQSQALAGLKSVEMMWFCHNRLNKLDKLMFRDLQHVEKLYMCNNSITVVQADTFQRMKALTFLDLSNNKLRVIKKNFFVDLLRLEELNLSSNEISDIQSDSFATLQQLRILDLSFNLLVQLSSDVFRGDIPLAQLSLRNCMLNKIEPKSFGNLANLNEINLEHNQLRLTDIRNLDIPALRTLRISFNDFAEPLDNVFDRFPSLQTLSIDNCGIHNLADHIFAKNINLVKIDLAHNQLRSISRNCFNGLNVFKELRLDHNLLTDFPHNALNNISTLESLSLSENALTSVDFFKLNGLPYLRSLRLSRNSISSLSGFNAVNLTQLDSVDLSHNQLGALPSNFFQNAITLQRLDLSYNLFVQIPSVALSEKSLPRLGWLNIAANPLSSIYGSSVDQYGLLREIHISHTKLDVLESNAFKVFTALQHLYLVQNRIIRISPGAFTSLQHLLTLDMSVNELQLLPRERLQGLHALRMLNISHNNLRDLEVFTADVGRLQVLDISFNQLHRIGEAHFAHLVELKELLLMGNRISVVSSEAFRSMPHLVVLDLRKNYFETVPLDALRVVETQLRRLRIEDNPLHCSCDSQELWQWLGDHPKWTRPDDTATAAAAAPTNTSSLIVPYLRCEQPPELRGLIFAQLEPQHFCDQPLILKLAIQDIQPYSVLVSWQGREHTGLTGFRIRYQALDSMTMSNSVDNAEIQSELLSAHAHSAKLRLASSTRYRICVSGLGNRFADAPIPAAADTTSAPPYSSLYASSPIFERRNISSLAANHRPPDDYHLLNTVHHPLLSDSVTSRCTEVRTLDAMPHGLQLDEHGLPAAGLIHSILTRRLGLIVGCFMGIIVFFVLITVLGWLKLKKRRIENAKRFHMPVPPGEYTTYRHFSIPHDEQSAVLREGLCNHHPTPAYISGAALGTTTTTSTISC